MKKKVLWLRISYMGGAIADGVTAILMLFPRFFVRFMNLNVDTDAAFEYGLQYGTPLMMGWTILLLWANHKPVERKGILLMTIPVLLGYIVLNLYSVTRGLALFGQKMPMLAFQLGLLVLFTFSYLNARDIPSSEGGCPASA